MKKLLAVFVIAFLLLSYAPVAFAASPQPSLTQITTAAASTQNEELSVPSGSVVPQPPMQPAGTQNAQNAQFIIIGVAIVVVVVLLVVFRRKFKRNRDDK